MKQSGCRVSRVECRWIGLYLTSVQAGKCRGSLICLLNHTDFLGAKAENLKHMTSVHTMKELFRTKVMILEENVEMLSRLPAQLEFFAASNQQPLNINIVRFLSTSVQGNL